MSMWCPDADAHDGPTSDSEQCLRRLLLEAIESASTNGRPAYWREHYNSDKSQLPLSRHTGLIRTNDMLSSLSGDH